MGNLIERDNLGNWSVKNLPWSKMHIDQKITQETNQVLYGCLAKLKDYEATGLSPTEVQQLKEKNAPVQ